MTTGERIKAARKKAGYTQKQLGELLGVTYQTLAQWENNLRNPKLETLNKISEALRISIAELLGPYEGPPLPGLGDGDKIDEMEVFNATPYERILLSSFRKLNDEGQQKAVERVEELTEIPKYQRKSEAE